MKKQIVSAFLLAVGISRCSKNQDEQPVIQSSSKVTLPSPMALRPEVMPSVNTDVDVVSVVDGGRVVPLNEHVEPVGLEHEHRVGVSHLEQARRHQEQGELEVALIQARQAVEDSPNDEEALSRVALLARKTNNLEVASEALSRLANLRPDDAVPLVQQARVLILMKRFEDAIEVGTAAMNRDSQQVESYQVVGRAYLSLGKLTEATQHFQKAVEIEPEHGYALNNLGLTYLRSNENEKALEVLEKAAEILPNVAFVHNNLGVALERTGRKEEAQLAYNQAMSLSPKYIKAIINSKRVAQLSTPDDEDVASSEKQSEEVPSQPSTTH